MRNQAHADHCNQLNPPSPQHIMKLFLPLTALIVSVPAFVLFTFGPVPAVGLITIVGSLAILISDYTPRPTHRLKLAPVRRPQSLPLAA